MYTNDSRQAQETKDVTIRLLAIDDDPEFLELVTEALAQEDLEIFSATDPEDGLRLALRKHPQIVLLDLHLPRLSGMDLLEQILAINPNADVIILTGDYSTESAVEAIRKGACDYLTKPLSVEKLRQRVAMLVEQGQQQHRDLQLLLELLATNQFEGIVGRSPAMQDVFVMIRRIAPHFRTALVTGATGTGKELVARALHRQSPAAKGPFVVCNCSAIAETLLESELFGHVRGSFTGASQDRIGLVEYANGGTLFLDEIGEMPLAMQAKLLRVLQNQEIQRVGSPVVRKVDVRIVAATHRDLRKMVAQKQFREDLYYRLSMVEIRLPRLAERKEDLALLQRHFSTRFANEYNKPVRAISRRAQVLLSRYSWPGNIRELENVIGHAFMMAQGDTIDIHDLPESVTLVAPGEITGDDQLISLAELQKRHVRRVLELVHGNKVKAASILHVGRSTLYRLLSENDSAMSAEEMLDQAVSAC